MTASHIATQMVRHMESYSRIIDKRKEAGIPKFDRNEVILGDLLGSGGFNHVYALHDIELNGYLATEESPEDHVARSSRSQQQQQQQQQRRSSKDGSTNTASTADSITADWYEEEQSSSRQRMVFEVKNGARYAVKFLKRETMENEDLFCSGAADLMIEAKILGSISHSNIVRLYGLAAAGANGFQYGVEGGFFLIVDQLDCTLSDQVCQWRQKQFKQEDRMMISQFLNRRREFQKFDHEFFLKRLDIALDLSSALRYLHHKSIIFRDLKPDNIGFTADGSLKLFDFGLAKELDPREQTSTINYKMSGQTGSRRYMAPEVVLNQPYNLSADVYSFIICLYEIFKLEPAYKGMTVDDHMVAVVEHGQRPPLDPTWPSVLSTILKSGWAADPYERPSMRLLHASFKKTIKSMKKHYALDQQQEEQAAAAAAAAAAAGSSPANPAAATAEARMANIGGARRQRRMSLNGSTPYMPPVAAATPAPPPVISVRHGAPNAAAAAYGDYSYGEGVPHQQQRQSSSSPPPPPAPSSSSPPPSSSGTPTTPTAKHPPGRKKASRRASM